MKRLRFALCIAAWCFCALYGSQACLAQKPSGPQISFKEKNHDFKLVDEGKILEHTFVISNTGDQPLIIEKVSPS